MTETQAPVGTSVATPVDAQRLRGAMGWSRAEMAAFLGLTPGAYAYRQRSGRFGLEDAMRLAALEDALEEAARVFRSKERAVKWLQARILGLQGRRPVELLKNPSGYKRVKDTLGKIEYGMY